MDPRTSRGFLNNNPGNVDRSADVWQGEIRDPDDPRLTPFQRNELVNGRFVVTISPQFGIRLLAKTLFAYAAVRKSGREAERADQATVGIQAIGRANKAAQRVDPSQKAIDNDPHNLDRVR